MYYSQKPNILWQNSMIMSAIENSMIWSAPSTPKVPTWTLNETRWTVHIFRGPWPTSYCCRHQSLHTETNSKEKDSIGQTICQIVRSNLSEIVVGDGQWIWHWRLAEKKEKASCKNGQSDYQRSLNLESKIPWYSILQKKPKFSTFFLLTLKVVESKNQSSFFVLNTP